MVTLYGISNCDTVKKARKWLEAQKIDYQFHDFRKDGLEREKINDWCNKIDWQILLNRRGTTWRKLSKDEQENVSESTICDVLLNNPTLIKRPVLTINDKVIVGFNIDQYETLC